MFDFNSKGNKTSGNNNNKKEIKPVKIIIITI